MSGKWFLLRGIAALIIVALVAGGVFAAYRFGWAHGYASGQMAEIGEETMPAWPFYAYRYHARPFAFGGLLLAIGGFFFLMALFRGIFHLLTWRKVAAMGWGARRMRYARHWHRHHPHGPMPPWCWDESPEGQEPGVEDEA
jgi:hypothetical protein